jgi:transglutaminase-like putative cysteine protease
MYHCRFDPSLTDRSLSVDEVLVLRRGGHAHLAAAFAELCSAAGIASVVVSGFVKANDYMPGRRHAFVVALLRRHLCTSSQGE